MSPPIRPERNKTAITLMKKPVFSCPCSVSRPGSPNQAKCSRWPSAEHSLVVSGQGETPTPHELATSYRDTILCGILFSTLGVSRHWIDLSKRTGKETFELPIPATYPVETDRSFVGDRKKDRIGECASSDVYRSRRVAPILNRSLLRLFGRQNLRHSCCFQSCVLSVLHSR